MAKAMDIANFFIAAANANESGNAMTNLRLQKMMFFAQAWYLARFHIPLFQEEITARQLGPIVQDVYSKVCKYGSSPILETQGEYTDDVFTDNEFSTLLDVLSYYDAYPTSKLISLSHDALWKKYKERREVMPQSEIMENFAKKKRPFETLDAALGALPVDKGKKDKDGNLIYS